MTVWYSGRMKRLGIDFGTKKIGIAVTDDAGKMAFPRAVVPNDESFVAYIVDVVTKEHIDEIVVGHSLNNHGEPNPVHKQVQDFIADITLSLGIPVHLEPEQYSSKQAGQIQGNTKLLDASAAAIILDSFITKQCN